MDESIFYRKDVYVLITQESRTSLKEFPNFIWYKDYSESEKKLYRYDIGKVESENHIFHFQYHNNIIVEDPLVKEKERSFLEKPRDSEMKDITLEEFEEQMDGLIEGRDKIVYKLY